VSILPAPANCNVNNNMIDSHHAFDNYPLLRVTIPETYRVTRIIVDDFEIKKFYVVNFTNRQTLYHSIGMINKIMCRKYYTDSYSATIIILNIATPKNCTITRRQTTLLQMNSVMAFSLSGIEPTRFCTVVKEIDLQDFRRRRSSAVSVCGSGLV